MENAGVVEKEKSFAVSLVILRRMRAKETNRTQLWSVLEHSSSIQVKNDATVRLFSHALEAALSAVNLTRSKPKNINK